MKKVTKGALAAVTVVSAALIPTVGDAAVAMAPEAVRDASSQKVVIVQPQSCIVENIDNYNRIKRLSDNHEKRKTNTGSSTYKEKLRSICVSE